MVKESEMKDGKREWLINTPFPEAMVMVISLLSSKKEVEGRRQAKSSRIENIYDPVTGT